MTFVGTDFVKKDDGVTKPTYLGAIGDALGIAADLYLLTLRCK